MKKIVQFVRTYKLFSLLVDAGLIALALDILDKDAAAHWLLGSICVLVLLPLVYKMWRDVRHGTYGVDILAATAIITALVMQEYWAAFIVTLMLTGGEALEHYAERRAKKELDALLDRAPQQAHVLKAHNKLVDVSVGAVRVGDKIEIRPGEVVPVDAEILEGTADFDESSLTGESLPQPKEAGDTILSGSVNIDSVITARALHTARDSQYQQVVKLVEAAAHSQAPFVRLADRYSIPFTALAFLIAGGAWYFSGESIRFLEVLVVATPCPLILAAPIAIVSGMSRAAKHGIIVKSGGALERLAQAKTIAFDKTGTLTEGNLAVESVTAYNGFTKSEVLGLAAGLEQSSNHLAARAIIQNALAKKVRVPKAKQVKEHPGRGVSGTVSGKHVLVGRLSFIEDSGVSDVPKNLKVQSTAVYVASNGRLAGMVTLADTVRPNSKPVIQKLKRLGMKQVLMITGDNSHAAQKVAKQLGIEDVASEALPGEKLVALEKVAQKPIVFVGDGVNDAPVLMAADVGIALGARGSTAASESADMVIMLDDIGHVGTVTDISKRTFKIAKQSIFIGIGLSVILMGVFATGRFTAVQGALVQEVVDIVVIVNALRAHGSGLKRKRA